MDSHPATRGESPRVRPPPTGQTLFPFEQEIVDADRAAEDARLRAKEAAKAQRAMLKRQAEIDKNTRRSMRGYLRAQKTPNEYAQCGIRWYSRSPRDVALGNYWKNCHACGQPLVYSSDHDAKPQVCPGRKV